MSFPKLPAKAAYLTIDNARRRNALSLAVLRSLRDQLHKYNTSPSDGKLRILPPFQPSTFTSWNAPPVPPIYQNLSESTPGSSSTGPPGANTVLICLSAGHDLSELRGLSHDEVKETFALCAEVISLIRRSPIPVVGAIHGLATAAGCQLALTTDLPIAKASTPFQLPGASIGLPCTSPSTAVSRKLGSNAFTYRMLALAEQVRADELPGQAVDVVKDDTEEAFEERVRQVVQRLVDLPAQPQAFGKWAFWTQVGIRGVEGGQADGYEDAVSWAGKVMALHARGEDAREGMASFAEKRRPQWKT
ncbi:Enoyl-CoA hydratase domain-containing protein 3, mitochondrial [Cyphellophora attinorum]|uniref:Enoyl-CoA hydratase domain-containing protein 3, mitochondrial n=1 Tax=Cyphellophora attinorum TaxID=1664694 RepID=A0A0N1HL98_9EURO|nr:Enoyl-CoA hydratase domain-containing protein 3, mitochondrial [Phialophora attinorum]KPI35245.1 Enoyl-CoA hydratase domain-containing protein 3, mitochondrial [Phialophora attinorum]